MASAGTADLRPDRVLPLAREVLARETGRDPAADLAVRAVRKVRRLTVEERLGDRRPGRRVAIFGDLSLAWAAPLADAPFVSVDAGFRDRLPRAPAELLEEAEAVEGLWARVGDGARVRYEYVEEPVARCRSRREGLRAFVALRTRRVVAFELGLPGRGFGGELAAASTLAVLTGGILSFWSMLMPAVWVGAGAGVAIAAGTAGAVSVQKNRRRAVVVVPLPRRS